MTSRRFRIVFKSEASLAVGEDIGQFLTTDLIGPWGPMEFRLHTEFVAQPGGARLPTELTVEAESQGPSLKEAIEGSAVVAHDLVALVALAANAGIDEPRLERGYEITHGVDRREFLQNLAGRPATEGRRIRFMDVDSSRRLIQGVQASAHADRVQRAARQYRAALAYLRPGGEALVVAHLFMGVEAITSVALKQESSRRSTNEAGLANEWGIPKSDQGRYDLLGAVRRKVVFQGDEQTHRDAKLASDGFEHGFKSWSGVQLLAERVYVRTAKYLREAILGCCALGDDATRKLMSYPYGHPVHNYGGVMMLSGFLSGRGEDLAAPGRVHPGVRRTALPGNAWRHSQGLTLEQQGLLETELARGISLADVEIIAESPEYDESRSDVRPISIELTKLGNARDVGM